MVKMVPGSAVEREHHPPGAAGMGAVPADPLGSARASDPVSRPGTVVPVAVGASGDGAVLFGARYERMSVHFVDNRRGTRGIRGCGTHGNGLAATSAADFRRRFFCSFSERMYIHLDPAVAQFPGRPVQGGPQGGPRAVPGTAPGAAPGAGRVIRGGSEPCWSKSTT